MKEEIQELNDSIIWWQNRCNAINRDNEQLQQRIDKAIKVLEQDGNEYTCIDHICEAIWILKGDSNE